MTAAELAVVVPLYGGIGLLADTFAALETHTSVAFDLIVVDNASPDGAGDWVEANVSAARVRRNPENLGFGSACDLGVLMTDAPLVCLLNSDARVEPGWFDALRAAIDSVPHAIAAVPMYLEEDGGLQEAGAAVDGRGEGVLLGHRQDASDPRFAFRRVVEYGSAACMLVRREEYLRSGGFDAAFAPAYYEDADLALRWLVTGHRVVYTPAARVTHLRGASPRPPDIDRLRDRNRARLRARWAAELDDRPAYDNLVRHPERLLALRDAVCGDRVLFLCDRIGAPDAADPASARVAEVAGRWPNTRICVAASEMPDAGAPAWGEVGVELAAGHDDWRAWFRDRIGQAGVVWTIGSRAAAAFAEDRLATQPQALSVYEPLAGDLDSELAARADLVTSAGRPAAAVFAIAGWAPTT